MVYVFFCCFFERIFFGLEIIFFVVVIVNEVVGIGSVVWENVFDI